MGKSDWLLIATGLSGASAYSATETRQKNLINNSRTLMKQAKLLDDDAHEEEQKGFQLSQNMKRHKEQLKGTQRSLFSSSGVTVDVGTAGDIVEETEMLGKIEENIILENAYGRARYKRKTAKFKIEQANVLADQAQDENPLFDAIVAGATAYASGM